MINVPPEILAERENAAQINEMLAKRWENSAKRIREEATFNGWAIWPPFAKRKFVAPSAENVARDIEAAAHGLRICARIIREGHRADQNENMITPEESCQSRTTVFDGQVSKAP
jgi:hypothetical protein